MVSRAILALALMALAALTAPAGAEDTRVGVVVAIAASADGVVAHYEFEHPVTRFPFEYQGDKQRDGFWTLKTPGLIFDKYDVRASNNEPFEAFDVAVSVRNEVTAAIYPALIRIGDGGRAIYLSYFAGKQDQFRTRLTFTVPQNQILLGLNDHRLFVDVARTAYGQAASTYLYVGPASYVQRTRFATFVAGPETPNWIVSEIEAKAVQSLDFYTAKTRIPLRRLPLFLVTSETDKLGHRSLQADVTDGPNVAFRFFGAQQERNDIDLESIRSIVPHEAAHFWNGHLYSSKDADKSPWLHEGGANYWAHVERRHFEHVDQKNIERALNTCVYRLGERSFSPTSGADYECGQTLEWFADLGLRSGGHDIFDLWRQMFAEAESNGGYYSIAMFRRLAGNTSPAVSESFRLVLDRSGNERWHELPGLLRRVGVVIEFAASGPNQRASAILHVLSLSCSHGSRGFWINEGYIKFETGNRCGALSGDPEADSINGHDMFTDTDAAYAAVDEACKSNGAVSFTRKGSDKAYTVTCSKPLPPLPPQFHIVSGG